MSPKSIPDDLVGRMTDDLRERYALDEDDVRALGARLAEDPRDARGPENAAFAERFTHEHRETFDRLAK